MTKRVLITGANGGIGSATAVTFAAAGWEVLGLDKGEPSESRARPIEFATCDLADGAATAKALHDLIDGRPLAALVNNAAHQLDKLLVETTDDEWDRVMTTNLRAPFICIREAHAALCSARGAVVNVASVHALATSKSVSAYAASKGGLVALTRAAAIEMAAFGVRVNAVLPGAIDTEMLRRGLTRRDHPGGPNGNLEDLVARTPLQSIGDPADIAASVLFLADSERSGFMTGQSIVVDGGALAQLRTE